MVQHSAYTCMSTKPEGIIAFRRHLLVCLYKAYIYRELQHMVVPSNHYRLSNLTRNVLWAVWQQYPLSDRHIREL